MANTVDDVLASAKLRAGYASTGNAGATTDSDLLRLSNDELLGVITGTLMSAIQGHFLTSTSIATTAGVTDYDIPQRAAGAKIAYAIMVDTSGNRRGLAIRNAMPTALSQRTSNGKPTVAFFEGNQLNLWPTPDGTETLQVGYYFRPNRMVLTSAGGVISSVSTTSVTNDTINLSATPPATFTVGTKMDVIQSTPHFKTLAYDLVIAAVNTNAIRFTTTISNASNISVGDYLNLANESCAPQLPVEIHPLLAARIALRLLRMRGDLQQSEGLISDINDLGSQLFEYLSSRDTLQSESVNSTDLDVGASRTFSFGTGLF